MVISATNAVGLPSSGAAVGRVLVCSGIETACVAVGAGPSGGPIMPSMVSAEPAWSACVEWLRVVAPSVIGTSGVSAGVVTTGSTAGVSVVRIPR